MYKPVGPIALDIEKNKLFLSNSSRSHSSGTESQEIPQVIKLHFKRNCVTFLECFSQKSQILCFSSMFQMEKKKDFESNPLILFSFLVLPHPVYSLVSGPLLVEMGLLPLRQCSWSQDLNYHLNSLAGITTPMSAPYNPQLPSQLIIFKPPCFLVIPQPKDLFWLFFPSEKNH